MALCCNLVKLYSKVLWSYISDVYSFQNMRVSEIGITNDLIYRFLQYYRNYPGFCDVYINHSYDEKTRGADIDLLIFNSVGVGSRYYIQSKVMNFEGKFKDIKKWNPMNTPQFQKLINWSSNPGHAGTPLYLLYSGMTINSNLGNSNNGLSIIDANIIRNFRYNQFYKNTHPTTSSLTFNILYNLGIDPFHVLFCSDDDNLRKSKYSNEKSYSLGDIEIAPPYSRLMSDEVATEESQFSSDSKTKYSEFPFYKIIIKNSERILENS